MDDDDDDDDDDLYTESELEKEERRNIFWLTDLLNLIWHSEYERCFINFPIKEYCQ